jgi:hypothetical protein
MGVSKIGDYDGSAKNSRPGDYRTPSKSIFAHPEHKRGEIG